MFSPRLLPQLLSFCVPGFCLFPPTGWVSQAIIKHGGKPCPPCHLLGTRKHLPRSLLQWTSASLPPSLCCGIGHLEKELLAGPGTFVHTRQALSQDIQYSAFRDETRTSGHRRNQTFKGFGFLQGQGSQDPWLRGLGHCLPFLTLFPVCPRVLL